MKLKKPQSDFCMHCSDRLQYCIVEQFALVLVAYTCQAQPSVVTRFTFCKGQVCNHHHQLLSSVSRPDTNQRISAKIDCWQARYEGSPG